MPGPHSSKEALPWIQEAMAAGRYFPDPHFEKRCRERGFTVHHAKRVIKTATSCTPYPTQPLRAGGTAWTVKGTDLDGQMTEVGVEACRDHLGRRVILVTVRDPR